MSMKRNIKLKRNMKLNSRAVIIDISIKEINYFISARMH